MCVCVYNHLYVPMCASVYICMGEICTCVHMCMLYSLSNQSKLSAMGENVESDDHRVGGS